jgi:Gas vesicle synthesis protein GvpO
MAERRQARRTTEAAGRRRRPYRDEPDVFGEDEAAEADEQQAFDEDDPGTAEADDQAMPDEDESAPSRVRKSPPDGRAGRRPALRGDSAMTAGEAAKAALSQVAQLTAKQPEAITGVERTDDGWAIGIEVVEDRRIPSSADILATYEATIDDQGELLSYQRVRRYPRGRGDNGKGS